MSTVEFVHRFEPAAEAPDGSTLLLLHSTGGNEDELMPLGRAISSRSNLLSPRGQVLENGMPRFFRRLAEGVFDHEDLVRRSHQLADFVAEAAKRHAFDPVRVFAVGFSNGEDPRRARGRARARGAERAARGAVAFGGGGGHAAVVAGRARARARGPGRRGGVVAQGAWLGTRGPVSDAGFEPVL